MADVKNLDYILISSSEEDLVPAFTLAGTTYLVTKEIPFSSFAALSNETGVEGLWGFVSECIPLPDQRASFNNLKGKIGVPGLNELVKQINEVTSPLDQES